MTYTASMGDWSNIKYETLPQTTSTWTQWIVIPRAVYFAPLDKSLSESFATILFGCAMVIYLKKTLTTDRDHREESTANTHTEEAQQAPPQSEQGSDGILSEKDPLCMTDQDNLCDFVQLKLDPLVKQLHAACQSESGHDCNSSLRMALLQKAVFYIKYANAGNEVFQLMMLEGKFGQQSAQVKAFKTFCSRTAHSVHVLLTFVFPVTIFIPNDAFRLALDVILLTLISCFVAVGAWAEYHSLEGSLRPRSKWTIATTAV